MVPTEDATDSRPREESSRPERDRATLGTCARSYTRQHNRKSKHYKKSREATYIASSRHKWR
eukprot:3970522-Amphidinium_carterae.2